ncbi:NmrA family transcriptional regulator [Saccharibacillus sp. VR-M41]|uniref:NmrA family transcriptional regulator n=2 Tax=Saccharibacillus alkalitolerans TaxID=2705290 RepID=A0ABX0F820_9BACL|nr:NmrA family transcriptional regulator [Saccharibacillus alkalitolerans]
MSSGTPVLVIGGTGKTGSRVARRLIDKGVPVRIGSRSGQTPFDWNHPETWQAALDGVEKVYMTYYPDLLVPEAEEAIGAFAEKAVRSGVRRMVLLSGRGEEEARRCELAALAAGGDTTVLRASWFAQNFSESFLLHSVLEGSILLPADDVPEPFVDAEDIADAAFAALTEEGHAGKVYELTGPRSLSFARASEEIGEASGRRIDYVRIPHAAFLETLRSQNVPEDIVFVMDALFGRVLDGRNAEPQPGVREATGHDPTDFSDYVRRAAASGAWDRA